MKTFSILSASTLQRKPRIDAIDSVDRMAVGARADPVVLQVTADVE